MAATEISRYELEALERRVKRLEQQRSDELEERSGRYQRHTNYIMAISLGVVILGLVIALTIEITLAVARD